MTQNPKVGSKVAIRMNVEEVIYDYVNYLQTIKGVIVARNTTQPFTTKENGTEPKITMDGNRAFYIISGKISSEIENEFETYYQVEVRNQSQDLTLYMLAGDFVVTEE